MITSANNYTKKKGKKPQTIRTLGQMAKAKAYREKSHKEAYTYTLKKEKKEKKKIYIYNREESNPINKQIYQ